MAPLAPICTNYKGRARAEKLRSFINIFQKVPKNTFFGLYFQNFVCGAELLLKQGLCRAFWPLFWRNRVLRVFSDSSENQNGRPKKRLSKFSIFFSEPPRRKIFAHATDSSTNARTIKTRYPNVKTCVQRRLIGILTKKLILF